MKAINATKLITAVAATCCAAQMANAQQKPNILIIYTDDMGIGDLSCYNNGWAQTPNLDQLAAQGVKLGKYYTAAPVSSPSRSGLTTGQYPLEVGINTYLSHKQHNAQWKQNDFLDPSIPTIADAMRSAGYATGHFGKWHMGGGRDVDNAPEITEYGFDEYVSTWESPNPDPVLTASDWIWCNNDSIKRWDRTAYFVDKTLAFFEKNKGKPCFVNFWPDDMHTPWVQGADVSLKEKSWETPENFDAVLKEYDRQIGMLMEGLRRLGLEQNTLVIFTSDNGPAPSFKQVRTNQLRGVKCSLYEGGIRMPMLVKWPEKIAPGTVDTTSVVCAVDIFPTLCQIAGAKIPKEAQLKGQVMTKALTGKGQTRKGDIMWEYGMGDRSAVKNTSQRSPHLAIRKGEMKLLVSSTSDVVELYDLSKDPQENKNIANQHPKLVKELKTKVLNWWNARPQINTK